MRAGAVFVAAMAGATAWGVPPAVVAAGAAPASLGGMIVEPDGAGARLRIAIGPGIRYAVTARPTRVLVVLEGVTAAPAVYRLALGPVLGIDVRPLPGPVTRLQIAVATRGETSVAAAVSDGQVLVVTVAPRRAAAPAGARAAGASRPDGPSQASAPPAPPGPARAVTLREGAGLLLPIDRLVRVAVADPRVLGVVPVSDRELLVTARAAGSTTMYVWDGTGRVSTYAVKVDPTPDRLEALRRVVTAMFPDAAVTVTEIPAAAGPVESAAASPARAAPSAPGTGPGVVEPRIPSGGDAPADADAGRPSPPAAIASGGVVLSGAVETQMDRRRVEEIARAFAPTVVDLLTVRRPVQLKLQVEVVELDRSAAGALGVAWGGGAAAPGGAPPLNGGVYNLQVTTTPGAGLSGLDLLMAQLQALVQQGHARLLAEPTLVVMAGTPASMLLGGQVPIPIAGPNGSVTIEYKDFGVILAARADYQDDGRVFMQLEPEVSTLDFGDAVRVGGFTIPALRVRRTQTAVSMRAQETLVLGGLLQRQDSQSIQKLPVLGDLPVIGPLFRSVQFQRDETELVIFVTPSLVETHDVPAPRP